MCILLSYSTRCSLGYKIAFYYQNICAECIRFCNSNLQQNKSSTSIEHTSIKHCFKFKCRNGMKVRMRRTYMFIGNLCTISSKIIFAFHFTVSHFIISVIESRKRNDTEMRKSILYACRRRTENIFICVDPVEWKSELMAITKKKSRRKSECSQVDHKQGTR